MSEYQIDEAAAFIMVYHVCGTTYCGHDLYQDCVLSFIKSGIEHERERAKVLVDTLERIEAGFQFDFDGTKASTHASLALAKYRGEK